MTATVSSFRAFTEIPVGTRDDAAVTAKLQLAALLVNPVFFGARTDAAVICLAAHLMAIAPVQIDTAAAFPWSPNTDEANLSRTPWGQMFLILRKASCVGAGGAVYDP